MTRKFYFFCALLSFGLLGNVQAQEENDFLNWGQGIIGPEVMNGNFHKFEGLKLYHKADGFAVGTIVSAKDVYSELAFQTEGSDPKPVKSKEFREVGYEQSGMVWYAKEKGFIQIGLNSSSKGYWLKIEELEYYGFKVTSYLDFMVEKKPTLFPGAMGINLNFRSAATTRSKVYATLNSDKFFVTPTGKTEGNWAEVEVVEYTNSYCEVSEVDENVVNRWTGWIKILDDKGHPNIWFYTRGC